MPPHPVDSGAFTKSSHEQIPPKEQIGPLGSSSSQPVGQSSQYRAHMSFTGKSPISLENTPPHPVLSGCSTKSLQLQSPPNRHAGLVGRASRHAKASAITSVEGGVGRRFTSQMLSLQTLKERRASFRETSTSLEINKKYIPITPVCKVVASYSAMRRTWRSAENSRGVSYDSTLTAVRNPLSSDPVP